MYRDIPPSTPLAGQPRTKALQGTRGRSGRCTWVGCNFEWAWFVFWREFTTPLLVVVWTFECYTRGTIIRRCTELRLSTPFMVDRQKCREHEKRCLCHAVGVAYLERRRQTMSNIGTERATLLPLRKQQQSVLSSNTCFPLEFDENSAFLRHTMSRDATRRHATSHPPRVSRQLVHPCLVSQYRAAGANARWIDRNNGHSVAFGGEPLSEHLSRKHVCTPCQVQGQR